MAFQLIKSVVDNQDYRGHAEKCTYTFTVPLPDQLGAGWTAEQLLNAHLPELTSQGSILLEWRLYEDKLSGTWTTDYKVEIVASASPLWWNLIIIGVLAAIFIIGVAWTIQNVEDIVKYSPGAGISIGIGMIAIAGVLLLALLTRQRRE